jgi:glutathione S-transferase
MAVRLHRCPLSFFKADSHPCWRVQKALDEANIDYVVVKEPLLPPRRKAYEELSGQRKLPAIEFEDGTVYRAESADMAARIAAGELGTTAPPAEQ